MQISLQGESQHYFSPGCPEEKKNDLLTQEFLALDQTVPTYSAKWCLGEKNAGA